VSFGATAVGCHDEWSDVDLIVVCAERDSAWLCSSVIRESLPVAFYRPFTAREQPDGRYWFKDESPLNRLDVSFETDQTFDAILSNSAKDGFDIITRDEYVAVRGIEPRQATAEITRCQPVNISQEETELGRLLYRALEAVKFALRGNLNWKWNREACLQELQTALAKSSRQNFAGSDLRGLAEKCFEINRELERKLRQSRAPDLAWLIRRI